MTASSRANLAYARLAPKRYSKDGVTIEAVQLTPDNGAEVFEWADSKPLVYGGETYGLRVFTPDGDARAVFGDYVVRCGNTGMFGVETVDSMAEWTEEAP